MEVCQIDDPRGRRQRPAPLFLRPRSPDEIPAGGEDLLEPIDVQNDPGFAKLGTARLDAWAERWLERFPDALTATEPEDEAFGIGTSLRRLALIGIPFSEPFQRRLIGTARPYKHVPDKLDIRSYFQETSSFDEEGARALLPVLARMTRDHEGNANFGDMGICYAFADHAEWQCHWSLNILAPVADEPAPRPERALPSSARMEQAAWHDVHAVACCSRAVERGQKPALPGSPCGRGAAALDRRRALGAGPVACRSRRQRG